MPRDLARSLPWPIRGFQIARDTPISRCDSHVRWLLSERKRGGTEKKNRSSVCIRDEKEAFSVRPRFPDMIKYLVLDVQDNEEQNLIRLFPSQVDCFFFLSGRDIYVFRAKLFIDGALSDPPCKVLVHCNGGISLSPAFVVMFVMQHYHISWEDALHLVQNRRYCISPNGGFLTQIKVSEKLEG